MASSDSHVRLEGAIEGLRAGNWVELVPRGPWPGGEASRPAQAVLLVTAIADDHADTILVGQRRPLLDLGELFGRVTDRPLLPLSKSVTRLLSRNDDEVRLAANFPEGVTEGDLFFVLGDPQGEPSRLGSRIVALVQVAEVSASGSRARILHQMAPIEAGDVAIFAHHEAIDRERPEALIVFTRTDPDRALDGFQLPPLANAVFDYQAEFQFSNIRIETLDVWVDPTAADAVEQAQDVAPEQGFGVIVFGQDRATQFLYNITTYGTTPSLATTVGILPGGLPLATPNGIEGISGQLAPSFIATALTQRGDHAEVIYFLEQCLREGRVSGDVAFHTREHLALRFESIGRVAEGDHLMSTDIQRAHEMDNPYAELNALSIREYLNRQQREFDRELSDLDEFLEVADDVLPAESLLPERLERSRILARLDRMDEALEQAQDVLSDARRQQRLQWEVSAHLAHANLLFQNGQIQEAIQMVVDGLPNARVVGDSYPRYSHALLAQMYSELNDEAQAMANLESAIAHAVADGEPYSQASMFELAATLNYGFDHIVDAVISMRQAEQLYADLDQFEDAARAHLQAGMLELSAITTTADPQFVHSAYEHLSQAAETYLAIGDGLSAAQAYGGMGMINAALGNSNSALAHFGGSIDLGEAYADPETVIIAYQRTAEIYAEADQFEQAQLAIQTARLWAQTFELQEWVDELNQLEEYLQSEI